VKAILLSATIVLFATVAFTQTLSELDKRNGFKSIKLGNPIDSVKEADFKKDIIEHKQFPLKLYETRHADYRSVGEVPVKKVELKTYKDLIYEINVIISKDPRVMQGLERSYGQASYSVRLHAYYWKGENLSLVFKTDGNQIHLTYKSAPVLKMMHADKGKKIEQVASEF
jgi:hypothetical protein